MRRNYLIIILLILGFLLGIGTLTSYGEGWDEFLLHRYANRSLSAYQTWATDGEVNITLDDLGGYGPSFLMLDELGYRLFRTILPLHSIDIYHLINFIIYLAGVWALYDIGVRWLPHKSAIGATLLLATQPIFWGHAFMNSKDIPFFAFFLLSLTFGFRLMDNYKEIALDVQSARDRRMLTLLTALWVVSIFGLFTLTGLIHSILTNLVQSAASGKTNIISLVASNIHTAPPEIYVQKYFLLFLRVRAVYALTLTLLLVYLYYRCSRSTLYGILPVLIPGILLGFTTSIRILGPLAGLLVVAYALRTQGKKATPNLVIYAIISIVVMYLTWPYLWENPVGHLLESLRLMSSYPWNGQVLFNGQRYMSTELPHSYLPVLLGIQLTEPVWILFFTGFVVVVTESLRQQTGKGISKRILLELTLLWLIIPILGFIIFRPSLYDNFRQVLFILPPIFLMAGVVFSKIKQPVWQIALIALVILPGVVDGIHLHPYEYIYYNRFIGGVNGAQRRFELDYWGTSYREAANYVNSIAPANAYVYVEGPAHIFDSFARRDLKVLDAYEPELDGQEYYFVALSRYNLDEVISPDAETVYTVSVDGAPLTVIKKP